MATVSGEFPQWQVDDLLLRRVVPADQDRVFRGLSDPQVIAHYGVSYASYDAASEQMAWFERIFAEGSGIWWAICQQQAPDLLIGACGLNDLCARHRRAEIGYWLLPEFWGRGIMQACVGSMLEFAFGSLGLHRLAAEVDVPNAASQRLLNRLGFRLEGTRRGYEWKDGVALDLQMYSKLASDPSH